MSFDFPSPVPKSEGPPSAGLGQAFDFAQYRLWGTLNWINDG
jgi:hypothetical protein